MRRILVVALAVLAASSDPASAQYTRTLSRPAELRSSEGFGMAVATNREFVAVGSYAPCNMWMCDPSAPTGTVRVYQRDSGTWSQLVRPAANDAGPGDQFGYSVAFTDGILAVGAPGHRHGESTGGSVYIFRRAGSEWVEEAELRPPGATDWFGTTVVASGDRVAVAAQTQMYELTLGEVHVFHFDGTAWKREATLTPPGPAKFGFNDAMALSGNRLVLGAPAADYSADKGYALGAVYVFEHDGTSWTLAETIVPDPSQSGQFGWSVGLEGDVLAVGSARDGGHASSRPPLVTIYRRAGSEWIPELSSAAPSSEDFYGIGLSVDAGRVLISSWRKGAILARRGQNWTVVKSVMIENPATAFGALKLGSVAISGSLGVVGAWDAVTIVDTAEGAGSTDAENLDALPEGYALHPNYPNPFNPSTLIAYDMPRDGMVRLSVYDLQGRLVEQVQSGYRAAGRHEVQFDATSLPSGVYLYRIEAGAYWATKRMVVLK